MGIQSYIIQRALGAESLAEAQRPIFAASLKLLMSAIVVIPGIGSAGLSREGQLDMARLASSPDSTYEFAGLVPDGLRGLVFAALIAAIVSSLASMMDSSPPFYDGYIQRLYFAGRTEAHYVGVGRPTLQLQFQLQYF